VSRNLLRMSLLSLVMFSSALPASAAQSTGISFAEAPVRLVRDTSLFVAARGARLQNGDIIESGASVIQLEGMGGATVALGPASRAYFKLAGGAIEVTLLSGWLKIQAGAAPSSTIVNAGALRVSPDGSSLIINAAPGKTALFVETGTPMVAEMQGAKQLHATKLAREQYAVRTTKEALKVLPRAPKDFLNGMPPAFFDQLVPVSFKGAAPAPKLERAAVFASDVAPMLADDPAVFQVLNRRFNPPPKRITPTTPPAPEKPAPRDTPIY
jgi:hypothetical protein